MMSNLDIDFENDRDHELYLEAIKRQNHVTNALKGFIIIQTCALVDEYNRFFSLQTDEPDEQHALKLKREVRVLLGPIIGQINKWTDLHEARNTFLAHGGRNKKDKTSAVAYFNDSGIRYRNIPFSDEEMCFLAALCWSLEDALVSYRPDFYQEQHALLAKNLKVIRSTETNSYDPIIKSHEHGQALHKEIQLRIDKELRNFVSTMKDTSNGFL